MLFTLAAEALMKTVWCVVILLILGIGAAEAGTVALTTSPVLGDRVTCLIANSGTKPITVTVDLVGSSGAINLATDTTISGGGFAAWGAGDDEIAYCRFAVTQGPAPAVRAAACAVIVALGEKCAATSEAR